LLTYSHPEILTDTAWAANHLDDPNMRFIEADEDYLLYETGHLPGAPTVNWFTTLQDSVRRDFIPQAAFEELCFSAGISNDTCVVFYGDRYNWFACYAFWLFDLPEAASDLFPASAPRNLFVFPSMI